MAKRLEPMTKIRLHLLLPLRKSNKLVTKKITCQGIVVRAQAVPDGNSFDTAIFFSDITPKDLQILVEFIDSDHPIQSNNT